MSIDLNPLDFPLHGTRLIEASAGTGKTWTIAALYVRLVLGHGDTESAFGRPLQPSEILVMTFTRAATRELSDRIRHRLLQTARCFRGLLKAEEIDDYLHALLASYADDQVRLTNAAHRLAMAAEAMDDAAIFTIDAWGQRMLREHAFDSGSLFDEELVDDEERLYRDAVRDYWRSQVYPLSEAQFAEIHPHWASLHALEHKSMRSLVARSSMLPPQIAGESLADAIDQTRQAILQQANLLKRAWVGQVAVLADWFGAHRSKVSGTKYPNKTVTSFFAAFQEWVSNPMQALPGEAFAKAADRWSLDKLAGAANAGCTYSPPPEFADIARLKSALDALPSMRSVLMTHAAHAIAARMARLKEAGHQFAFADLLSRLRAGLEGTNAAALRQRIIRQYPVALIDEFQDTSPDQYRIFDALYRVQENQPSTGMFLIGDPKQAIYGFRGADIHSYLAARAATQGRHYRLGTNFRSTAAVVDAVNCLFLHAEGQPPDAGHARGAFGFRRAENNPVPFEPVNAKGRKEQLLRNGDALPAMTICVNASEEALNKADFLFKFGEHCAQEIVSLLNDPTLQFVTTEQSARLQPADIAVLVRDRFEAAAIQRALRRRRVASVYLSDKDSVFKSIEAADMLRWLSAIANPLDARLGRIAFATTTAGLPIALLQAFSTDDLLWEARVEQLKRLQKIWQRQGVLAALRQCMHEFNTLAPANVEAGGERRLTNLLHLAELLQRESRKLDGEHALIRWLHEQIDGEGGSSDESTLRLESDAQLVKVITVFKAKGLEFPIVFVPFAVSARAFTSRNKDYVEVIDPETAARSIDFTLADPVIAAKEAARLEEDLRLLYVALTRARHALWLGVASIKNEVHLSAFGYLIDGGAVLDDTALRVRLAEVCGSYSSIAVTVADGVAERDLLQARAEPVALIEGTRYNSDFERDWSITSYTAITKGLLPVFTPATPSEEHMETEGVDPVVTGPLQPQVWHLFPRGVIPGQFLHAQLEWIALNGFDVDEPTFAYRLAARCERAGWVHRQDEIISWLSEAVRTSLPPVGIPLANLTQFQAEMEFWVPANDLRIDLIDRLCQRTLPSGAARSLLSERAVTGMLRGFQDLVFSHEGRYWVLDYKSNALGNTDADYHHAALTAAVAQHRYDVQGMLYLLALHRLLCLRLGAAYDPAQQLGGVLFYFLRGIGNVQTRGCYRLVPDLALLGELDQLLDGAAVHAAVA